jgi:hypothetical protein
MTKSTSPAYYAGLPAIDRRSLVCGLGTAAIAGVSASTAPMSDDPVFQAIAALEQLKIHAEEPDAAHSVAEDAVFAARKENIVTLDGEEMRLMSRSTLISRRRLVLEMKSNSIPLSSDFARAICLPPNGPNATWRAKPLTTNWPGEKRKLPKSNSALDIEKSKCERNPPRMPFGMLNMKSWRPNRRQRLALLLCCASSPA